MQKLTEGSILKVLTKLALPIMASSFLSTAYSITDMAWIGKLGSGAIAGMGNTKLCSIIIILFTGFRIPLAYGLSRTGLGLDGIWWALTATSICKGIVFVLAFRQLTKKRASE